MRQRKKNSGLNHLIDVLIVILSIWSNFDENWANMIKLGVKKSKTGQKSQNDHIFKAHFTP
jgi:hypothetical protein